MALLSFLFNNKPKSASAAKERLQIIIARERSGRDTGHDFLQEMHKELLAVISKYTNVNADDIKISLDRQGNLEVLDVNVILPDAGPTRN